MDSEKEELAATFKAYREMSELDRLGRKLTKTDYYKALSMSFGRSPNYYEAKMQNISYVYSRLGRKWLKGLKPRANVGANVTRMIEELIHEEDGSQITYKLEIEDEISKLLRTDIPEPLGVRKPRTKVSQRPEYYRSSEVIAFVLKASKGFCECCRKPAPFKKDDGDFYLEVHHLRRLADKGSDTVSNAVAVCPNCHRELHYGHSKQEKLSDLYRRIPRLVPE